ncbi:MAG: Na(+)-translocating NADH-quinone reductase subunit A [Pseudomonadales bacterium]|nr:Na(+)-translocating NADH-quinone reductase subunit A [Pseudomonadales bacterium]
MIKIKRGLDLPIEGAPRQAIEAGATARSVALIGFDYIGMKPTMSVQEGDRVKLGQMLFSDKKNAGVKYTSPGTGVVSAINRGDKRALQSVVIDLDGDEEITFDSYAAADLSSLDGAKVREQLIESGSWASLRTRPFSKVPSIDSTANAIFVTAMDTNPLAADPALIIAASASDFENGLTVLSRLGASTVYCCVAADSTVSVGNSGAELAAFSGPHPAGLAGTHIHNLAPASASRVAWTINYQDVIAFGKLFSEGRISVARTVSLAGPSVNDPVLLQTRTGACIDELIAGKVSGADPRAISGSIFNGRKARGAYAYLGRYHQQITVLEEGRDREFMSYLRAGVNKHSVTRTFISSLASSKLFSFTTTTNGSDRAMVPIGSYERVMPLDILPTQLLRALLVGDTSTAQKLGCLELDEEDLALCTYVCPGKYEYGPILRDNLTQIEKEG